MGPYFHPYYWVDEFIPYFMEMSWELIDPGTHGYPKLCCGKGVVVGIRI